MPIYHRITDKEHSHYDELLNALIHEWQAPQEGEAEPIIIEEAPELAARTNHVYVIWSQWASLSPFERSKIILHAFTKLKGAESAADITVSLGLTPEEARFLKLNTGVA